ncbi:DM13 domain-containing protein [Micrococcaceae bacterium Sec5.7]
MNLTRHRKLLAALGTVALVAVIAGAALFQPWRIFTSSQLDEALPAAAAPSSIQVESPTAVTRVPSGPPVTQAPAPAPAILATGAFQSQEHATTGTASLLNLPDGTKVIRLENLASSDGPDVKVWLSSLEAGGDWFKYRSGKYVDLGAIKATHGNQNYTVPEGTDISALTTVVLWCDRFSVAFGSAQLTPAPRSAR